MANRIRRRRLFPYETRSDYGPASPCIVYQLANRLESGSVAQYDVYDPDGVVLQQSVAIVGRQDRPTYRAAIYYDGQGNLSASSLNIFHPNSPVLYSRSQTEYDESGRVVGHLTWLFRTDGSVEQSTNTSFFFGGGSVYQSTEVVEFDATQQIIARRVLYYDDQVREIAQEVDQYSAGDVLSVTKTTYDERGLPIHEFIITDAGKWNGDFAPVSSSFAYLVQASDAVQSIGDVLRPWYKRVLLMNSLPAQDNLESVLKAAGSTSAELQRFRALNQYFDLCRDVATAMHENDRTPLYAKYATLLDPATGAWTDAWEQFAQAEGLTLPLPPLRIAELMPTDGASQNEQLLAQYRELLGDQPERYFQAFRRQRAGHVNQLLEGMRKVKALIKLKEYEARGVYPAFDWWSDSTVRSGEELGLQQIVPLTGWYFFEQHDDGSYIDDQVSEQILQQRMQTNMTNEDVFYVMNIEHWPLDGSPAEMDASLAKLRQVADLIHRFNPNLLIGFYRLLPQRDPSTTYDDPASTSYRAWQEKNDHVAAALENAIDVLYPSLYVLHLGDDSNTTEELWSTYARESVLEARRIGDGKPVIAFLSLQYQPNGRDLLVNRPNNVKAWQPIEPEFLLYQMSMLDEIADGQVLYFVPNSGASSGEFEVLFDAITAFQAAHRKRGLGEIRTFYAQFLARHRNELIERQRIERRLEEIRWERFDALNEDDSTRVETLAMEGRVLEYRLRGRIDVWSQVTAFVQGLE